MLTSKKERALEFAEHVTKQGFIAHIASRGNYGFFTDVDGKRVVSFQVDFWSIRLSGNYHASRASGTGWGMGEIEYISSLAKQDLNRLLNANAPYWANLKPVYTTAEEHLDAYGKSSNYTLYEGAA